jgi:hypothetical protein
MNYSELHNFYEDKKIHSNINYTLRKYNPIKTKSPPSSFTRKRRVFPKHNSKALLLF